ncbi:MAG: hypothetical protein ABH814_00065, partial [bacterium]
FYCPTHTQNIALGTSSLPADYQYINPDWSISPSEGLVYSAAGPQNITRNFYVYYNPPSWMQVDGSDVFVNTVNMTVPAVQYLTTGIPFAVGAELVCSPGPASLNFGDGIADYGKYNFGGSDPWPFAWNFGDPTTGFSQRPDNYFGFISGTWYTDTPVHFEAQSNYRVDDPTPPATSGQGVAYLVVSGDVTVDSNFVKQAGAPNSGLVVFIGGDLTIDGSVGSNVSSPNYNLEAIFVVAGDVIVEGDQDVLTSNGQFRIKGGLYVDYLQGVGGELDIVRAFEKDERQNYPIVYIEGDPVYWLYDTHSSLSKTPLTWEEI